MSKTLIAAVLSACLATSAQAQQRLYPARDGYRYAPPYGHGYVPRGYQRGYLAPRYYVPPRSDYAPPGHPMADAVAAAIAREAQRLIPLAGYAVSQRIAPPPVAVEPRSLPQESREQWKERLRDEGREYCATYPDDAVCGGR